MDKNAPSLQIENDRKPEKYPQKFVFAEYRKKTGLSDIDKKAPSLDQSMSMMTKYPYRK